MSECETESRGEEHQSEQDGSAEPLVKQARSEDAQSDEGQSKRARSEHAQSDEGQSKPARSEEARSEETPFEETRFDDLPDGSGCTEIWEHLSERRETSKSAREGDPEE